MAFIKDLLIYFTPSLNLDQDINATVGKAHKVLGFTKRNTKTFTSTSYFCTFYFALVRSILEYGGIVWHPYLAKEQLRLKHVLNKLLSYASLILKIKHLLYDYFLICNTLKIPTLFSRHFNADSSYIFSLLNSSIDAPDLLSLISFCIPSYSTKNHHALLLLLFIAIHRT